MELENTEILTIETRWLKSERGHIYQSTEHKPQQRRWRGGEEVTICHHHGTISSRRKSRQSAEGVGGWVGCVLVITILHNVPNSIVKTSELKKLTGVRERSCELNFIS